VQKITEGQNKVSITDRMWARLLSSTNQPSFLDTSHVEEEEKREENKEIQAPSTGTDNGNN
jgi:6-phosphofructokinase 1